MKSRDEIKIYISSFEVLLDKVNVEKVSANDYCKKYLAHLILHKKYYLLIYADVLQKVLNYSGKAKEEIVLLDFGAGNGLMGIFAKSCGFKKVYINDIDPSFLIAAEALSREIKIDVDGFIGGDAENVKDYFKGEELDAIAGTDVIEHIYDLDVFFSNLKQINPQLVSVFTTASNPENIFKTRALKKLQIKDENEGYFPSENNILGGEIHEPFIKMRQKIIELNFKTLSAKEVLMISTNTRGLIERDIKLAVENYLATGIMPGPPNHPTNTCHPISGSWTERILPLKNYYSLYKRHGFGLKVYNGFYNTDKAILKKILGFVLNTAIKIFKYKISPFIFLVGYPSRE